MYMINIHKNKNKKEEEGFESYTRKNRRNKKSSAKY